MNPSSRSGYAAALPAAPPRVERRGKAILDTRWLAIVFLFCALPTGLGLALLTPIGQVADEPTHIARAAGLLHGQIMGQRFVIHDPATGENVPFSGVMANSALIEASMAEYNPDHRAVTPAQVRAAKAIAWPPPGSKPLQIAGAPNTVQYFPALYLPGTIGIALMRFWGGTPLQTLYAGRVAMLLFYVAVGMAAIAVAAFGRALLFATLSLPMALSLAGSFNQDGPLIALSALAGALLTLDPREHPGWRFAALPLISLVLCSKPPYGLLILAFLWPLAGHGLVRRLAAVLLFAVPPVIWVLLMMHSAEVPYAMAAYHPRAFWPGDFNLVFHGTDPAANLRVLLAKPSRLIHMPIQFLIHDDTWRYLIDQAIGWLGWLSISLAPWAYEGWKIALLAAAAAILFDTNPLAIRWRALDAGFVLLLAVLSFIAVILAIYLSWDKVGDTLISGPQGRYFLLFIPFLMLVVPRLLPSRLHQGGAVPAIEGLLVLPAIVMALIDTGYLPWLILHRFYLS